MSVYRLILLTMKNLNSTLFVTGLLSAATAPLFAQSEPVPPSVPALESGVSLQITLTTTGAEKLSGPDTAKVHTAGFDVTRLNTKDFIALLDEKYDLVAQPKDFSLVAVLVDTETEDGYRFYLKNTKKNGTPAYVYLAPEIIGLTIDASAGSYREVQNGEALTSGRGKYKHAVTLDTAGFSTQGISSGGYTVRNVTVDEVTSQLEVPSATKVETTGYYVENPGTEDAATYIAETRWTFNAAKAVNLNDYPAPPAPEVPEAPAP